MPKVKVEWLKEGVKQTTKFNLNSYDDGSTEALEMLLSLVHNRRNIITGVSIETVISERVITNDDGPKAI